MAQASSAQPPLPRKKPNPVQRAFGMFIGFLPWIVYWSLVGNVSFRVAVVIACAISVAISGQAFLQRRAPKVIEAGGTILFVLLLLLTFLTNDAFLERWLQPITNGGLFLIALVSVLIGKPFTLQYAREHAAPEMVETPLFFHVNLIITWVWVLAFAVMTASSLIPPFVQGRATLTDSTSLLSILCYWIIPFSALGLAALFTFWFPDWFVRQRQKPRPPRVRYEPEPPIDY
jgi:hypothetical protein